MPHAIHPVQWHHPVPGDREAAGVLGRVAAGGLVAAALHLAVGQLREPPAVQDLVRGFDIYTHTYIHIHAPVPPCLLSFLCFVWYNHPSTNLTPTSTTTPTPNPKNTHRYWQTLIWIGVVTVAKFGLFFFLLAASDRFGAWGHFLFSPLCVPSFLIR